MADFIDRALATSHPFANGRYDHENANEHFILGYESYREWLGGLPSADVRPVVRGRWILDSDPGEPWKYKCDQCGEVTNNTCMGEPRYNYCPMCGADMMEDKR